MASLRKALSKVVSHSRSSSKSSSRITSNGDAHPVANGHADKAKQSTKDDVSSGSSAAQTQQKPEGHDLKRPDSLAIGKKMSFTELKEERRVDREAHDEEETRARKERMKKAHDEVREPEYLLGRLFNVVLQDPLRDNWGDLDFNTYHPHIGEYLRPSFMAAGKG